MREYLWDITLFWTNIKLSPIKKTHQKLVPMCLWLCEYIPNFYRLLVQLIFRQELLPLEIIVQHLLLLHQ